MDRKELRKKTLEKRDKLSQDQQIEKSMLIQNMIYESKYIIDAKSILSYVHFRSEVKTNIFINNCLSDFKKMSVPITLTNKNELRAVQITDPENDLQAGYCSIPEPIPKLLASSTVDPQKIDVVIVPGSVFDSNGGRLGYGGGYYDRFLTQSSPMALRIAFAFELQMVDKVPMEKHDQFMDIVVTEKQLYYCR